MAKIIHEKEKCIGCMACESMAANHWEMDEEAMKAHLKGSQQEGENFVLDVEDYKELMEAAEVCPVNCVHIEVDGEKKI